MEKWTDWICKNMNGEETGIANILEDGIFTGIGAYEQGGYGVVNLRVDFVFEHLLTHSGLVCDNPNGALKTADLHNNPDIKGICAFEQGGYGLVDIGIIYNNGSKLWATGNHRGVEHTLLADDIEGIQCRYQGGYGIVNLRCALKN